MLLVKEHANLPSFGQPYGLQIALQPGMTIGRIRVTLAGA